MLEHNGIVNKFIILVCLLSWWSLVSAADPPSCTQMGTIIWFLMFSLCLYSSAMFILIAHSLWYFWHSKTVSFLCRIISFIVTYLTIMQFLLLYCTVLRRTYAVGMVKKVHLHFLDSVCFVSFAVIISFIIFPKLILTKKLHLGVVAHKVCEHCFSVFNFTWYIKVRWIIVAKYWEKQKTVQFPFFSTSFWTWLYNLLLYVWHTYKLLLITDDLTWTV